jgi:Predicted symporter
VLSGSSYLARDVYRQIATDITDRREALVGQAGVIVLALISFGLSLLQPGTIIEIGDTAFGGFAQLTLPVIIALYWQGTTRDGMLAGVIGSQLFYIPSVIGSIPFVPFYSRLAGVFPDAYVLPFAPGLGGFSPSLAGMALGVVLTVGVSLVTSPETTEDASLYDTLSAD